MELILTYGRTRALREVLATKGLQELGNPDSRGPRTGPISAEWNAWDFIQHGQWWRTAVGTTSVIEKEKAQT